MRRDHYFDNAASTPLDPRVLDAMLPWMTGVGANANSLHAAGREAHAAIERARSQVAEMIGAEDGAQIVFTSGATEGANTVIAAHAQGWISPYEHSAVREPALTRGYTFGTGPGLPCQMAVNNETGALFETLPDSLCDATQAHGKLLWTVDDCAYALGSAHKLYGPKGIGFLYLRDGLIEPLLRGGEGEDGRRAGTPDVAAIVGLGEACALAEAETDRMAGLRSAFLDALSTVPDTRVNAPGVPHILSLSFHGLEAETILIDLDRAGFAVSAGAACSSRSAEPSHVLTALGLEPAWLRGTIRVSWGRFSTMDATLTLARNIVEIVQRLRTMK